MKADFVQKVIVLRHGQKKEKQLSTQDTDMVQH
jgi:hypothetical protein